MKASLHALLEGIVDYAGLFPPAALPMGEAVAEFARHRGGARSWMLSSFICPARRLREFGDRAEGRIAGGVPWTLSVLGTGGETTDAFLKAAATDRGSIEAAEVRQPVSARAFEAPLPPEMALDRDPSEPARELVAGVREAFRGSRVSRVFFEASADRETLDRLFSALAGAERSFGGGPDPGDAAVESPRPLRVGVKIRTGGMDPSAVPSVETVAEFLLAAHAAGLPVKATAGLHHPLRHDNAGLGGPMHGFLNVFVGAVLLAARGIGRDDLLAVLRERSADAFAFDDGGLGFAGMRVETNDVERARRSAVSFGSCSFREPIEDLESLGLLERRRL
jgi:hypothetical protein